ncbi:MAG: GTP-binding protein [Candidatus Heimdallarchaeota archaeon]|nr:GTP-binding protein [Candidatus Heimdallarchaeota archaeon]
MTVEKEKRVEKKDLEELLILYDEVYETEYFYDASDLSDILKLPREVRRERPIPNFKPFLIDAFTQPLVDFKTHFCGTILIGFPGSGKTTFLQYIAEIIQETYGLDKINILISNDFIRSVDSMNEKEVQVLFTDDAMAIQDKRSLAGKALANIRHISTAKRLAILYPDDFGYLGKMTVEELLEYNLDQLALPEEQERIGKRGIVYIFFNTQEFYGIAVDIRRQCKILIFKSASTNPRDAPELIKLLGKKSFQKLRSISKSTLKNKEFDADLSKALVISLAHDEAGIVDFSELFDRKRLREVWKHVQGVNRIEVENRDNYAKITLQRYTDEGVFDRLPEILLEELYKNQKLLEVAQKKIGKSTLKRNITMWYLRQFCGWDYNDLKIEFKTGGEKQSTRVFISSVRNFLVRNNAFKAIISERWVLEQIRQNSTVSPRGLFVEQKKKKWFRSEISNQHPDLYLSVDKQLAGFLAVKMHFERETFHPSPEVQYAQAYDKPVYALIIDVCGEETNLRFAKIPPKNYELEEQKKDTVEIRRDFEEIITILKKDLLPKEKEKKN